MEKYALIRENEAGISFVMSGKVAKLFTTKDAAESYAVGHKMTSWTILPVIKKRNFGSQFFIYISNI